jgi:hypothetical protein
MYYDQRIMDVEDNLPKYAKGVREGQLWSPP